MAEKTKAKPAPLSREMAWEIAAAVSAVQLKDLPIWSKLDVLSHQTTVEALEAFEDDIDYDPRTKKFRGHLSAYVTLQYGSGTDRDQVSEGFPGTFEGHIKDGKPHIDSIEVDTSSFHD